MSEYATNIDDILDEINENENNTDKEVDMEELAQIIEKQLGSSKKKGKKKKTTEDNKKEVSKGKETVAELSVVPKKKMLQKAPPKTKSKDLLLKKVGTWFVIFMIVSNPILIQLLVKKFEKLTKLGRTGLTTIQALMFVVFMLIADKFFIKA